MKFHQDSDTPGVLEAIDDSYLLQKDKWYILSADPNDHMIVYYTGSNKAWNSFSGGVVYSRTPIISSTALRKLKNVSKTIGNDIFSIENMCSTDTGCSLMTSAKK